MRSFSLFSEHFRTAVCSARFGEPTKGRPLLDTSTQSPASKEIASKQCLDEMTGKPFLKSVYALVKKYQDRELRRAKLGALPAATQREITKLRNAQKTMATVCKKIRRVYFSLGPNEWDVPNEIVTAMKYLQDGEDRLLRREEYLCWSLDPKHRKPHYQRSRWDPIWETYKDLKPPASRAADHWLISALNELLVQELRESKRLSGMTRYRIIAEILRSADIGICEVGAIKQYLITHPRQQIRKNSPRLAKD
jgi:hypothetical protein